MAKPDGIQFQRYYHGSWVGPDRIMTEGLKQNDPTEGLRATEEMRAQWAVTHPKGVYLTTSKEQAQGYGGHVYSVDLPTNHPQLKQAKLGDVWQGDIPPHFIRHEQ